MSATLCTPQPPPWTIHATVEQLAWAASAYWTLTANGPFFMAALDHRSFTQSSTWLYATALVAITLTAHFTVLAALSTRWSIKPLLALLIPITALASYFLQAYGVYLNPSMLRNALHTDYAEASELINARMGLHLALYGALPLVLLRRVHVIAPEGWRGTLYGLGKRAAQLLAAVVVLLVAVWAQFQPLSSLVRNHHEVRYLLTPLNYLSSLLRVAHAQTLHAAASPRRLPPAIEAGTVWSQRSKPFVIVLVLGETVRAANWQLSGYPRPTTPQLAKRTDLINFPTVQTCGTDTEVSVPCLFSAGGKHDYQLSRIQSEASLLHILANAGISVHWRDNQSGCKGVCDGLPADNAADHLPTHRCAGARCLDDILFDDLRERLQAAHGAHLWVLHMLGNHGPAYWRRYPKAFEFFSPACHDEDLSRCQVPTIINAYDNALRYTDHLLAQAIDQLEAQAQRVDTLLIYLPDHGESLGEHHFFLHGAPELIAPREQTQVPMLMWMSPGARELPPFKMGCLYPELQRRSALPTSHDHLYHTLMGFFDVRTKAYAAQWDLTANCQRT